jgi:hypothetical protein
MRENTKALLFEAAGYGLDILQQSAVAVKVLIKASPWLFVIWILFIAPNC